MASDGWSGWRGWARVAAFVALYFVLMSAAYNFAWERGLVATMWWNPSGLALGVLMRAPRRAWLPLLGTMGVGVLIGGLVGIPAPRRSA